MDTHKRIVSGVVLLTALLALAYWIGSMYIHQGPKVYIYEPAGFSFEYQSSFAVVEKIQGENLSIISLKRISDENNVPVGGTPGSEVEPRIQCALFKNTSVIPLSAWIHSPDYALLMGRIIEGTTYPSADIPNREALGFKTDGLYVSDHVAFEHKGHIIDCSVEYITLDDPLRMEFALFIANQLRVQ